MAQYLLLLHGGNEELKEYSPEDLQKLLEKYDAWVWELQEREYLKAAQKLKDESGRVVSLGDDGNIVDGLFTETKETIGGYFLIEATDYGAAVKQAKTCPILTHGGSIELRELEGDCRYPYPE